MSQAYCSSRKPNASLGGWCDRNRRHLFVCDLLHYFGKQSPEASSALQPAMGFWVPPFHFRAPFKVVCSEASAFQPHGNSACMSTLFDSRQEKERAAMTALSPIEKTL
jgi:hypothetical protein